MTIIKVAFFSLIISLYTTSLFAGERVELTSKDLGVQDGAEETMLFLFSQGHMKMSDGADTDMVFNPEDQNMTIISHDSKSFMTLDQQTGSDMQNQMQQAMEQAMANVPPEQRAMMESIMKQRMGNMGAMAQMQPEPEKTDIRETGLSDTINGYDCEYYEVYRNDEKQNEYCIASWDELGVSDNIQNSFKAMGEFMQGFLDNINKMTPTQMNNNPFANMSEMNGFPILNREFSNGVAIEETVLSSISEQDIDENVFSVPEGYNQQSMMGR